MWLVFYVCTVVVLFMVGLALPTAPTWVVALLMALILMGPLTLVDWNEK